MLQTTPVSRLYAYIAQLSQNLLNPRFQLATLTLFALLQKSPALFRVANTLKTSIDPATRILQKVTLAAASLGTTHALSGSSPANYSVSLNTVSSSGLQSFEAELNPSSESTIVFLLGSVLAGTRNPRSWSVTGTIPEGITVEGVSNGNRIPLNAQNVFNAPSGVISGAPTQSGTFVLDLKPWEGRNATQRTADALQLTLTITPLELIDPVATIENQETQFIITWSIAPLQNYELQFSDNPLDDQSWTPFPATIQTASETQTATLPKETLPDGVLIRVASTPK